MTKAVDFLWSRREDMLLFIFALIIATLLFGQLQIGQEPGREREFDVPLTFAELGDDIVVVQAPRSVRVLASGNQQALDALDTSKVRAFVDLSGVEPGVRKLRIEVIGPMRSGLTLTSTKSFADLQIEQKVRKTFDVELLTVGTPPGNFTFTGTTLTPARVEVSGPASNLPQVLAVRAVFDLTNLTPNQSVDVELEALGDQNKPVPLITIEPPMVQILPAVSIGQSKRNLLVTPVFTGQPAIGFRVTSYDVIPNQVSTVGDSGDVSRVTTVDTEAIDLTGLRTSRRFTVKLVLPPGVEATDGEEVTVYVRVSQG